MTAQPAQPAEAAWAAAAAADPFYDSVTPGAIPPGTDACLYHDGDFAAPLIIYDRFRRVRRITVFADYRHCSIQDVLEQRWYRPALLRSFVRGRRAYAMDAIVYTDRAQAAEAVSALRDFGHGDLLSYERLLWWISTLDDVQRTPDELAAELAATWGAPEVIPDRIWGQQWRTGVYDTSRRFLPW